MPTPLHATVGYRLAPLPRTSRLHFPEGPLPCLSSLRGHPDASTRTAACCRVLPTCTSRRRPHLRLHMKTAVCRHAPPACISGRGPHTSFQSRRLPCPRILRCFVHASISPVACTRGVFCLWHPRGGDDAHASHTHACTHNTPTYAPTRAQPPYPLTHTLL